MKPPHHTSLSILPSQTSPSKSLSPPNATMSFGWSAGDILSIIKLITNIITSLHRTRGSASHFQELELELQTLQRALIEIDALTGENDQIPEICALSLRVVGVGRRWKGFGRG
jgi:hypothetical protein